MSQYPYLKKKVSCGERIDDASAQTSMCDDAIGDWRNTHSHAGVRPSLKTEREREREREREVRVRP